MRRSIMHAAVVSLVTLTIGACADVTPTGLLTPSGPSKAATPPPGPGVPLPPLPRPPRMDPNDFADITAGENHTCARKNNNTIYCWGATYHGQTGRFPTASCSGVQCVDIPSIVTVIIPPNYTTPVPLTAPQIDAGSNHTCAIDTTGDAYCWGEGHWYGQSGVYNDLQEPTKIVTSLKFSLIGAGGESTCGETASGVYCWGKIAGNKAAPTLGSGFSTFKALAVGNLHGCGIDGSGSMPGGTGITYCWGDNKFGQLNVDNVLIPSAVPTVMPRDLVHSMARVSAGTDFTCAEMPDGTARCFGQGTAGQLGNGQMTSTWVAQVVGTANVSTGQILHGISAGFEHACAIDASNGAWCWGSNTRGELGNGLSGGSLATPQRVSTTMTFRAIAAGSQHTCAIGTDNHIYCWGDNTYGQLGAQLTPGQGGFFPTPQQAKDPIP